MIVIDFIEATNNLSAPLHADHLHMEHILPAFRRSQKLSLYGVRSTQWSTLASQIIARQKKGHTLSELFNSSISPAILNYSTE